MVNQMSVIVGIIITVLSVGIGVYNGYKYADRMPEDNYGKCLWMAAKSKAGANVKDCEPFIQDMTVSGRIENYKKCREINKLLKPEIADKQKLLDFELNCAELKPDAVKYTK